MLPVHALVHYMHDEHPYALAMRSANAIPWLEHGQYPFAVRLDDKLRVLAHAESTRGGASAPRP